MIFIVEAIPTLRRWSHTNLSVHHLPDDSSRWLIYVDDKLARYKTGSDWAVYIWTKEGYSTVTVTHSSMKHRILLSMRIRVGLPSPYVFS